jgi:hypothetical protein
MPIDPSIIGNVMAPQAPQLPDVNAMLETQTRGAENIFKIETARQEQARAEQERAAAAEEDALVKALLPAYTYGIETGDMAGALNLVPPDMQEGILPYVQALEGKSPEQVRAALIGSLSTSKAGQEALAAMQRAQTAQIQFGQLTLAQQEAQRKADEAALGPQPEPMSEYQKAQQDLAERRFAAEQEKAAREAAMPDGMDPKTKLKLDQSYPQASRALQSSVTNIQSDISDVEKLLADEKGLKAITGTLNAMTPNIFADATRAQALLDKIMSGAGFSALQAMRDASPTGGALGNVSNQEGAKLEKSVAAFSQKQEYGDFREALRQYLIDLKIAQENVQSAFDETYSYRGEAPSAGIVEETTKRRGRIEQETAPATPKTALPPGVTVKRN